MATTSVRVRWTADPLAFARVATPLMAAAPVTHSVLATTLARAVADQHAAPNALWLWLERDGRPVALAMHTPPYPPYLPGAGGERDPGDAVVAGTEFAGTLRGLRREVTGVGGDADAGQAFATRWAQLSGAVAAVRRRDTVYELPGEPAAPAPAPGAARAADAGDLAVVLAWGELLGEAVGEPGMFGQAVEALTRAGHMTLWQVDGTPVAMAAASLPQQGVSRIQAVFTPAPMRGRGYAAACVAHVSAAQVAAGARCMLHADQANPTSNRLYLRLGYRPVGHAASWELTPA
jgi:GNAT superfamily N-acetyltransferase